MKKLIMGLCALIAATTTNAQGLEGLVVEKYYVSNANDSVVSAAQGGGNLRVGSVTWRFYADLAAGHKLQAVYGVDAAPTGAPGTLTSGDHELRIATSTTFFNNEDRGATTPTFSKANTALNSVLLDSWLSVGAACVGHFGIEKSADNGVNNTANANGMLLNNNPSAGIPLTTQDGLISGSPEAVTFVGINNPGDLSMFDATSGAGSLFTTYNGSWASLNGSTGPNASNKVLFAQITTDGILTYKFNLQVGTPTGGVERYVYSSPAGAEILFPSLSGQVNVPNACPTVSITSPTNGASYFVGDTITINATAADSDGTLTGVAFRVNGTTVNTDNSAPYSAKYVTASAGTLNLTAVATDNEGCATTSSTVSVTVGTNAAPTVSITAPTNGANLIEGATVALNATAADADGTITQVEFFVGGVSVGVDNSSPYSVNWTAVIGNQTITARATDNNNASTTSSVVSVTVISSSAAYTVVSSDNSCDVSSICVPVAAVVAVDNVKGYDLVIQYDTSKVQPSGVITVYSNLIDPSYVTYATSIDAANGKLNLSLYLNGTAPANTEFSGTGNLFCAEFSRKAGFLAKDTALFSVPTLQESYISGVQQKLTNSGRATTSQNKLFTSNLTFWSNGSPLGYDGTGTGTNRTDVFGDSVCANLSATAVQPNAGGSFTYDLSKGPAVNIQRDITNTTSVQPVVNGFDAFLVRRLLINDATFVPTVYQLIAADVNLDGVVSAGDLSQINQRAVLILGEFQQAWNYNPIGNPLGPKSKDWLFIDQSALATPAYQISSTFPLDNGTGFSKQRVPVVSFCRPVPVLVDATSGCVSVGQETYTGILFGDVNGNFSTVGSGGTFKTGSELVFNLADATYANGYVDVPVKISSADEVNAVDIALNFNSSKLTYTTTASNSAQVNVLDHLNTGDNTLRVTSYSLNAMDKNQAAFNIRFASASKHVSETDFSSVEAYINGEPVAFKFNAEASGVSNMTNEIIVNVFPNPAKDQITVIVSDNASVELFDVNGKQVVAQTNVTANTSYQINSSNLASGVYTLKIGTEKSFTAKRVVISK
jgi:hypothetical protein